MVSQVRADRSLHISEPQAGFYVYRLVKKGPLVPVLIYRPTLVECHENGFCQWLDRWPRELVARVGTNPDHRDPLPMWPYLRPTNRQDYLYRLCTAYWQESWAPHLPNANPDKPVDLNEQPPIF